MTRSLGATNLSHIDSGHTHPVLMGKFLFDGGAVYAHTGLGTIVFESNNYLGVGSLAGLSGLEETESIVPAPVKVQLNGLDSALTLEALDAANYGAKVTLYIGYRNDDGTLIADPWVFYKGRVENSNLIRGVANSINVTIQHDLAILNRNIGTKYTDEEQQRRYSGDLAFETVDQTAVVAQDLFWGRSTGIGSGGSGAEDPRVPPRGGDTELR
jgi:hypothetical protein